MSKRYYFVDGGALRAHLDKFSRKYGDGRELEVDFQSITGGVEKVFYYDAIPIRREDEDELAYRSRSDPSRVLLDRAASTDRIHVFQGDLRRRDVRKGQEQKMVDIALAVDALNHTFRKNMDIAIFLTGDLDFKPLFDSLVMLGMTVELRYTMSAPKELIQSADIRRPITVPDTLNIITNESRSHINAPRVSGFQSFNSSVAAPPDMVGSGGEQFWIRINEKNVDILVERWNEVIEVSCNNIKLTKDYLKDAHNISIPEQLIERIEDIYLRISDI